MGVLDVLDPCVTPAVLALVVPRPSFGVPDDRAVGTGVGVRSLEDASVELPCRVVSVVVPDIEVSAGVVAVEAGGGSGALGGGSLPPQAAAPRRRMKTELIAFRFMNTSE